MANHPSALKRARQNRKKRMRNRAVISAIKTQAKKVLDSVENSNAEGAVKQLQKTVSLFHKGVSKGVLHRNKASRKISGLSRKVHKLIAAS